MTPEDLDTVVDVALGDLPLEVQANLEEVEVVIVDSHRDPRCSEFTEEHPDFQGLFIGTPMKESPADVAADDPSRQLPPPVGTIYLNAANIPDQDEALYVLHHELGHALGLSEKEVDELGLTSHAEDEDGGDIADDEDDEEGEAP